MYGDADAVVEGRVVDVDWGFLRVAWCGIKTLLGADVEDAEVTCGVRVTLAVDRYWKQIDSATVEIATGRGGGDCGVRFEVGQAYLLYLRRAHHDPVVFATDICMRPQRLSEAAPDLLVLGAGKEPQ